MKIVWICNMIFPEQAEFLQLEVVVRGGWLSGMASALADIQGIRLMICTTTNLVDKLTYISGKQHDYCLVPNFGDGIKCSSNVKDDFIAVFSDVKPDLIHIHGTEYSHTLEAVKVAEKLEIKHIISVQGLTTTCAVHYLNGIPNKYQWISTLRDFLKRDNLRQQQKKFENRGVNELESLRNTKYVIGRTDWDRGTTAVINPERKYFFCNEILRDSFYSNSSWSIKKCKRHSIFISQASYPIKGFHIFLKALALVKRQFPDVTVRIAGENIFSNISFKDKIRKSTYAVYIEKMIKRYALEKNIQFIGGIEEEEMKKEFLNSHVFVSASLVENESNSVSEAKILGVPVVSSYVGGVAERIIHYEDGLLYPVDEYYMLANYIIEIFNDDNFANKLSIKAIQNQRMINDKKVNSTRMIEIYEQILAER